ncbi:gamma-glutamyl-gamma-aminobutyrate hydrolase family protein [Butyrivibrio sp. WCD2001]|uniref:gamma-glutamyl-gamma-aminobutyrate hydrolase family protein n=1 Tax=Butyrivibrio sp. WCD2001 TaxID=1280681 RepID=UPI0004078C24|nr:gamma-glutamyl-gamma-aminobutyrate hydrolase family protein [Butyrivibrio sp. WCD2001]
MIDKRKPIIGISPLFDDEKDSLWMLPGYMDGITQAGGIPIMLPLTSDKETIRQLLDTVDGILLTGGQDVSPEIYGEEKLDSSVVCYEARDSMEKELLVQALEKDIPILGICRGIQFLNAYLGGSLYQDLGKQHPSETEHHQKPPYDVPVHEVNIIEGSGLHKLIQSDRISVNSYHHQAVKEVADSLKVMAVSEDGLTEAVELPGKRFVWALQWHPEFSYKKDDNSRRIFKEFVSRCSDC